LVLIYPLLEQSHGVIYQQEHQTGKQNQTYGYCNPESDCFALGILIEYLLGHISAVVDTNLSFAFTKINFLFGHGNIVQ